jgi:hypothetical protein
MAAMTRALRRYAILALLGMAWSALLPFSAAARMLLTHAPTEFCHKLSIESAIDPDPASPEGPSQPRKASCPFCASAAPAAPANPLPLPCFVAFQVGVASGPYAAPTPSGLEVEIPLSRAPPGAART